MHERLGVLAVAAGDAAGADQHHRAAPTIGVRLAAADPGHAQYQRDLAYVYVRERLANSPTPTTRSEPGNPPQINVRASAASSATFGHRRCTGSPATPVRAGPADV